MYCVFCRSEDLPAQWAYRGLKQRGLAPLEIFTPEALVYNRRLEHRFQAGETITRIELADGRVLDSDRVRGVLNRINFLPVEHFNVAGLDDRAYAVQEQQAIFLSWMYALPGEVINRPGARGLCGDHRSAAEWVWLATQAGLPVLPFHQSDEQPLEFTPTNPTFQLVVFDSEVYGASAHWCQADLRNSIGRLAELSRLRLIGLDFSISSAGEPLVMSATTLPDLRLGGEILLDALIAVFA
ncbi:MAG: hypothetical protein A2W35_16035 [Chloroflexi bacterium RBG_16_57_11]|nr:MAG: hypothetical protein A2W35_16035 [Chloroflexi bacterium RBG_16_57_11]